MPRGLCSRPAVISLALWASPLFAWAAPADAPVAVRVTIQAGQALRNMRGGIGASWHAIGTELPGKKPDSGGSYSGSAWGANPDPADDKAWQQLYAHANWLGLDWCSVEIEQRMYQPGRRRFSWDNRDMRALYRILDWAEQNGVDVFLQQMWANVEWNAYPGLEGDPVGRLRSAPRSITDFAQGFGELVAYLAREKAYKCIRWLSINNEPGWDDFSWWQDSNFRSLPIAPA